MVYDNIKCVLVPVHIYAFSMNEVRAFDRISVGERRKPLSGERRKPLSGENASKCLRYQTKTL